MLEPEQLHYLVPILNLAGQLNPALKVLGVILDYHLGHQIRVLSSSVEFNL